MFEFLLLCSILAITAIGGKRRWHGRWFETRGRNISARAIR